MALIGALHKEPFNFPVGYFLTEGEGASRLGRR
jgi:hypothetical protein